MLTLSICVPTYNRPAQLKGLSDRFLSKVMDVYGDLVEIIVCDNSDADIANQNKANLDTRVTYTKNHQNIGVSKNFVRCVELASAQYIWLLSDDDDIIWDGFAALMDALKEGRSDCYLLSYEFTTDLDDTIAQRYMFLNPEKRHVTADMFPAGQYFLPFTLLSAGVVRLDKSALPEIKEHFEGNLFIQIVMFMSMLKDDGAVEVLPPVIDYNPAYRVQFDVVALFKSYIAVTHYLEKRFPTVYESHDLYFTIAIASSIDLLIRHRAGLIRLKTVQGARWELLKVLKQHPDPRSLKMLLVTFLPKWLASWWYTIFLARLSVNMPPTVKGTGFSMSDSDRPENETTSWSSTKQKFTRFKNAVKTIRAKIAHYKKFEA
jgi:glycosyltransferase involved in cell wall biosynthesis